MTPLQRLTRQDAGYLRRETAVQPLHFVLLATVGSRPDGSPVTTADVRAHLAARLDRLPELRKTVRHPPLGIGSPVWVDHERVDLLRHVTDWDGAGDDEDALLDGFAAVTGTQLDTRQPLWHLRVARPRHDGTTVLALSIHHALMDGGLLAAVLAELFGPGSSDPYEHRVSARPPSFLRLLGTGLADAARHRLRGGRRGAPPTDAVPALPAVGGALAGPVGPRRAVASFELPLAQVLDLRRALDATVNDLYLGAVTAGVRRVLVERAQRLPGDRILALVPRDVRDSAAQRATGNRTWAMLVPLPVDEADTRRRLAAVTAATVVAKAQQRSAGTAGFAFDVAATNVRLGQGHAVAGAPVLRYDATAPLQGSNRLVAVALSYGDSFTVTFNADADAFADLPVLAAAARDEFATLADARVTA